MAQEIDINLNVNAEQADKSLGSLKSQLREAQADVQTLADKFGATSREAIEAAKRAAELKDRIGDAKSLTDAYNPDAKFKALTGALTGVAGGFSVVTGALGAFGGESKLIEESLLKVQSAMAMASGLQAIGESIDQFKILKTVIFGATAAKTADTAATEANNASQSKNIIGRGIQIVQTGIQTTLTAGLTAATWLFNAAMNASPIGAIVTVIALLIASGYALINMFKESSAAAKKSELANKALANEIKNNKKEQDKANDTFQASRDHQLGMAKASGKSAEEIRKLTLQLAKQEVQQKLTNYETNRATALEARRRAGLEDATDEAKKNAEEATKLSNESTKALEQAVKRRRDIESQNAIARQQEQTDAYKDAQEKQKKAGDDAVNTAKENAKKLADEKKRQAEEDLKALEEGKKRSKENDDSLRNEINEAISKAQDKQSEFLVSAQETEEQIVKDKYFRLIEYAKQFGIDTKDLEIAKDNELNDIRLAAQDKKYKDQKAIDDKEIADAKIVAQAKLDIQNAHLDNISAGISLLQNLGIKNKGIQKGLVIAENAAGIAKTIINTMAANAKAVAASPLTAGQPFVTANTISGAIGVASSVAATAKALSALGGGSAGGGSTMPSGGAAAPSFNIVGPSGANQIAESIGNKESQPLKAFVVGGDVTSQQSLNRGIVQNATLG